MYIWKKIRKNSSFNWFTPFHVLIHPDVIWKKLSRPLYHVHFTLIHTNSRHKTVYSDADQRKHQSSASLAFVRGSHRWPVNSPHKWPVTQKCFHLMMSSWVRTSTNNIPYYLYQKRQALRHYRGRFSSVPFVRHRGTNSELLTHDDLC